MSSLLEVKSLKAYYGPIEVVHGIDFKLPVGGVATLLGANGAGKTTSCARCPAWCDRLVK